MQSYNFPSCRCNYRKWDVIIRDKKCVQRTWSFIVFDAFISVVNSYTSMVSINFNPVQHMLFFTLIYLFTIFSFIFKSWFACKKMPTRSYIFMTILFYPTIKRMYIEFLLLRWFISGNRCLIISHNTNSMQLPTHPIPIMTLHLNQNCG